MRRSSTRRVALLAVSGLLLSGCAVAFAVDDDVADVVETTTATLAGSQTTEPTPSPSPVAEPTPVEVREDVSRERPAQLLVAHLEPAAPGSTVPGLKTAEDGSRWQVVGRQDVRVVRVVLTPQNADTLVRIKVNRPSGPRFAQVSRTAGRDHGTLGLLTLDGGLLATMKAPQPLTNGFLELPAFSERAAALDFVNRVTKSRP